MIITPNLHPNHLTTSSSEDALLDVSLTEIEFPKVRELVAVHSMTSLGKEEILSALPTDDIAWLTAEHERINEMVTLIMSGETFPLERTEDIHNHLATSRIPGAYLQAAGLLDVLEVLQSSRRVFLYVEQLSEKIPALSELCSAIYQNRLLEKHITEAIDETGNIRDNATKDLQRIRADIFDTTARLRNRINRLREKLGEEEHLQEEFVTVRDGRFVLPLKAERKRVIPGIIHSISQSGSTVFFEPAETFELNNELSLLHSEEQREIIKILTTLTGEIGGVAEDIEVSLSILTRIDAIHSKAQYATKVGGIKPNITNNNFIELRNIFHPLLVQSKQRKDVIPLSITFGQDEHSSTITGHLISGPNAGGKSVAMKSIGLNIAMAVSGFFPIGEVTTNPRRIMTAIGDHQSIESDLSTFSSQIVRLREILSHCTYDSLVLVDEICSGTDPTEGSALACGILDSLIERGVCFVVTTHQSSLKSYALNKANIANASLEFNTESMLPTYRFLQGVPGNSYAFELSRSVKLQDVVLERAKFYLGDKHSELEQSIAIMQKYRLEAEQIRMKVHEEHQLAEKKRKDYEQRFDEFKAKYKHLMLVANEEAKEVVRKAQSQIDAVIKEARENAKPVQEIKSAVEVLRKEISENLEKFSTKPTQSESVVFSVGDKVTIVGSQQAGTIVEIEGTKQALVDFNGIKFKVALKELEPTSAKPLNKPQRTSSSNLKLEATASLDVRGMRAYEAITELDLFISNAVLGNIPLCTIIHGKGTGALRQAIHEHLKQHPQVKTFSLGAIGEGDAGVTNIELR
jgi:DNA mismatch repair protein MutS2